MKILIVDDSETNGMILKNFCRREGHLVVTAENGKKAVEKFISVRPDLIFVNANMPVMDGFETTQKIKALSGERWVSVILTFAGHDEVDFAKGISVGVDDYLSYPVHLKILEGKMKVMQRIVDIEKTTRSHLKELEFYQEKTEEELHLAKHVLDHLVREIDIKDHLLKKWCLPAKIFSGDVVAATMAERDRMHVILADGTGHGLTSAICMLPVTEIFYVMSEKGFPIAAIAREINKKMNFLLPTDRFIAGVLASINWLEQTIEIWNGGGPPIFFVNQQGKISKTFKSRHLPLGILSDESFDLKTDFYQWIQEGELFLYSDGLSEARDPVGQIFGEERIKKTIGCVSSNRFEVLRQALQHHLADGPGDDDISLISIQCKDQVKKDIDLKLCFEHPSISLVTEGELEIQLRPCDLKSTDILPTLLIWLRQSGISKTHTQQIFLILSELYNNALDYGLLGLDSSIKSATDGFDTYLRLRSNRLDQLVEGAIYMRLELLEEDDENILQIVVKDSGSGFDYRSYLNKDISCLRSPHGRGIVLIRQLSRKVAYLNEGSEVRVEYLLKPADATE